MNSPILPVLIVGAGPTGLTLAAQLQRLGVPFRLIDKHPSPLILSKAAAIHANSLEIFQQLGISDAVLREGQRVDILDLRTFYRDRLALDFSLLEHTDFPFMIDLSQYRTEQLLIDHLTAQGVTLDREVVLQSFRDLGDHVEATVQHKDGRNETWRVRWILGCDGVNSKVREIANLPFEGAAYADDWVLVDAELDWPLPRNEMTFSSDGQGIFGVFPLPGERQYRVAYTQNRDADGHPVTPDLADIQASLARSGLPGKALSAGKFWTFDLAHKQAASYRRGRAFLVGDAGHVHTPFGGQGMNLGIGDASNLAWKLALVEKGLADERLLDSYSVERHTVSRFVIRTTHLGASAMLMRGSRFAPLRDAAMNLIQNFPAARRFLTASLSQLGHSYQGTPFVQGHAASLAGGDRAPNQRFFDGLSQRYTQLNTLLSPDKHTLMLVSSGLDNLASHRTLLAFKEQALADYGQLLDVSIVTTDPTARAALPTDRVWIDRGRKLDQYHVPGKLSAYLVRPDQHLAYAHAPADWLHLEAFLRRVYGNGQRSRFGPVATPFEPQFA